MTYPNLLEEIHLQKLWAELERRARLCQAGLCTYCERKPDTKPCRFPERHSGVMDDAIMFLVNVRHELHSAQSKFPEPDGAVAALAEEVGELAKAYLQEPTERIYLEAVQVACMAVRVAIEGDPTLDDVRARRVGDSLGCEACGRSKPTGYTKCRSCSFGPTSLEGRVEAAWRAADQRTDAERDALRDIGLPAGEFDCLPHSVVGIRRLDR